MKLFLKEFLSSEITFLTFSFIFFILNAFCWCGVFRPNLFQQFLDRITITETHLELAISPEIRKQFSGKKTLYLRCFTWIWMRFCIMVELLKTINTCHIYWCQNKPKVKNDLKHIFNFRLILRVPSRLFQVIWPFATHSVHFYTLEKILLHLL